MTAAVLQGIYALSPLVAILTEAESGQSHWGPGRHHQAGLGGLEASIVSAMDLEGGGVHEGQPAPGALDVDRRGGGG